MSQPAPSSIVDNLISTFLALISDWKGSHWILNSSHRLHDGTVHLTRELRNRAVHTDDLVRDDYEKCQCLVAGTEGLLWHLHTAVETHK